MEALQGTFNRTDRVTREMSFFMFTRQLLAMNREVPEKGTRKTKGGNEAMEIEDVKEIIPLARRRVFLFTFRHHALRKEPWPQRFPRATVWNSTHPCGTQAIPG